MSPHITGISGRFPNSDIQLDISLDSKNLILTGANGSGKTWFLKQLHSITIEKVMMAEPTLSQLREELKGLEEKGNPEGRGDAYHSHASRLNFLKQQINHYESNIYVELDNHTPMRGNEIIMFFEADRKAVINSAPSISSVDTSKQQWRSQIGHSTVGGTLEQHLANLKSRAAIAAHYEEDVAFANKIDQWFTDQEKNLKLLMEDETTKLVYDPNKYTFSITREGKRDTNFQSLSSGYSSILSIYSEILMRTEVLEISPSDFEGIAFIDEIETHLHVSLQRLVLPFFKNAFPKIQFIVSTHSPFILTSTTDAIVYDISTNSVIDDDLSLFPYSAVMSGVLKTKATSIVLEQIIKKISTLINSSPVDTNALRNELNKIYTSFDLLDARSKTFYRLAEKVLVDEGEDHVQG